MLMATVGLVLPVAIDGLPGLRELSVGEVDAGSVLRSVGASGAATILVDHRTTPCIRAPVNEAPSVSHP